MATVEQIAPGAVRRSSLRNPKAWLSFAVWALLLAAVGLEVVASGTDAASELLGGFSGYITIAVVAYGALGTALAWARPHHRLAWIALGIAGVHAASLPVAAYSGLAVDRDLPAAGWAVWAASWMWVLGYLAVPTVLLLYFPDGRLPSRRWRPAALLTATALALCAFGWATLPYADHDKPTGAGLEHPLPLEFAGAVLNVGGILAMASVVAALASLVIRHRRSRGAERQQVRWLLMGAAATVVLLAAAIAAGPERGGAVIVALGMVPLPVTIAVAVLRHRLWDVDVVINRSLVYAILTVLVLATYVATVSLLGGMVGRGTGAPLVATALVAIGIQPVRQRVQAWVNQALYGQRDDPYTAMARLIERLDAAEGTTDTLGGVAETVCRVLRAPFATVEVRGVPRSVWGRPTGGELLDVPLAFRGEPIGSVRVALPGDSLDPGDRRLLDDLARHIAVAAHTEQLTDDLVASRRQLVEAREEERRRIRRDLHDELGPTLASVAMRIEQAHAAGSEATVMLAGVPERMREAVASVRRLVEGLRPAALDELGLEAAVREQARRFTNDVLTTDVVVFGEDLADVSAALDVAAYRIVSEALANVARHSGAAHCRVELRRADGALHIEVRDDGRGFGEADGTGIGLSSMRERAAEVGGECTVTSTTSGTLVRARLPTTS